MTWHFRNPMLAKKRMFGKRIRARRRARAWRWTEDRQRKLDAKDTIVNILRAVQWQRSAAEAIIRSGKYTDRDLMLRLLREFPSDMLAAEED